MDIKIIGIMVTIGIISVIALVLFFLGYKLMFQPKRFMIGVVNVIMSHAILGLYFVFRIMPLQKEIQYYLDNNIWIVIIPFLIGFIGTGYYLFRKRKKIDTII